MPVVVADDFRTGVRALAAATPSLVILDARTSGLDPIAWSRIAKAGDMRPKVFLVTDDADSGSQKLAADGYLQRPVRSLDLVRAVELAAR